MKEIEVKENKIVIANQLLQECKEGQELKKKIEAREKKVKAEILKVMKENGIKSFENDVVKITYVPESKKKTLDTDMLKALGIYDDFLIETTASDFVRMTFKKGGKE